LAGLLGGSVFFCAAACAGFLACFACASFAGFSFRSPSFFETRFEFADEISIMLLEFGSMFSPRGIGAG
jgi:hypothetical protein